jgi:succinate-acetate transporter protein
MWLASWAVHAALGIVFTLLLATFILLAAAEFTEATLMVRIAGYAGIITAISAWYVSAATVLNAMYGRTILPVGPAAADKAKEAVGRIIERLYDLAPLSRSSRRSE